MTAKKKPNAADVYANAIADFPAEALSTDSSRGFDLTSVKAQYVRERLNEVFGFMNWSLKGEYREVNDGKGVLYFGQLTVKVGEVANTQETVGYAAVKKNIGDAYKGAQTDCLSKCASNFGIANEVFKGNVAPPKGAASARSPPKKTTTRSTP